MKERLYPVLTAVVFACYGCGQEDAQALSSGAASAGNAVVLTAMLDTLIADPADADALVSMTRIYTELSAVASSGVEVPLSWRGVTKAPLDQCVTQEDSRITYAECSLRNGRLDGTIASAGDDLELDLTTRVQGAGASGSLEVRMRGSLVLSERSLCGELRYDTVIGGLDEFPSGLAVELHARYVDIALDGQGCPLGGTLEVVQETLGGSMLATVGFGPRCGQARVLP